MALNEFQGGVVDALNAQDQRNQDLLEQVIVAANAVSSDDQAADITADTNGDGQKNLYDVQDENGDGNTTDDVNKHGGLEWGDKRASLSGTGGVALLEYAKDAIQTAVSNISGMGTNQIAAKKLVERKMSNLG